MVSPSRQAVLDAAAVLTAEDSAATFTPAQVRQAAAALGHTWSLGTVSELLCDEVAVAAGRLSRVRPGLYRLRSAVVPRDAAESLTVPQRVLLAMLQLAAQGLLAVRSVEVERAVEAAGARYSGRAVLAGLLALRRSEPALVRRGDDGLYRLTDAGRGTAALVSP